MDPNMVVSLMLAPMYFPLAWICAECLSRSTTRLKNKGTKWDSGINGLGTFYARMLHHLPFAFGGIIATCILTLFDLDAAQYIPRRDFPSGLVVVVFSIGTVMLMIFGWRARLAREAYVEWKKLERGQPQFTEVNGNLYRLTRVFNDGRTDYEIVSPSERLQANHTYVAEAEKRSSKASSELVIALVISVVLWMILAFVLSKFRHHPLWDAAIPTALATFICTYPVGAWITASWDLSAHRGNGQYISAPRPIEELANVVNLEEVSNVKPTGAANFASATPPEPPQSPHQPPQSPHQPAATPEPRYKNPFV